MIESYLKSNETNMKKNITYTQRTKTVHTKSSKQRPTDESEMSARLKIEEKCLHDDHCEINLISL